VAEALALPNAMRLLRMWSSKLKSEADEKGVRHGNVSDAFCFI